ncbi:N-acetyl-gamma-glutamyl-phosphate reductase [Lachnospiraceae bacterium OttesenSCG-928-D06]|nr:N-acetyl-gamma-glutamyl-phosphate reductase [Lachnospiraceae bacterium OttesenSCG-928-D06]
MKHKIYVDGQEGTTGLEIHERLSKRTDVEILKIEPEKRKDLTERKALLNEADVVFLCLPDDAARESVSLIENQSTKVIDGSTAHRVSENWVYGIPELSTEQREKIQQAKRVSNPGCFATGFNMIVYPLVKEGILPKDHLVSCHAVTGYSGGGRRLIETYNNEENKEALSSPCFYALGLHHKHIPEMQKQSGLTYPPIFTPILGNYYRGMTVAIPLHTRQLQKKMTASSMQKFYADYYQGQNFAKVMPFGIEENLPWNYLDAQGCNNTNKIEFFITGHEEQILLCARLDNLGKGASGAAIQNMNIMLGVTETYTLV